MWDEAVYKVWERSFMMVLICDQRQDEVCHI